MKRHNTHIDGSVTKREKKKSKDLKSTYGHKPLSEQELDFLTKENPKIVYVGNRSLISTANYSEAMSILNKYETVILPTNQITEKNRSEDRKMVALIHVTC